MLDDELDQEQEERFRKAEEHLRSTQPELRDSQIAVLMECLRSMMVPEWDD
jgi:hypothetical protein